MQRQPEMAPGNIRRAEPRVGSPAHGREDAAHTRHHCTDSDRGAQESQTRQTEREEEVQKGRTRRMCGCAPMTSWQGTS